MLPRAPRGSDILGDFPAQRPSYVAKSRISRRRNSSSMFRNATNGIGGAASFWATVLLTEPQRQLPCDVPMRIRLFIFVLGALFLVSGGRASVIFRPGEKVKYVAPGEEEINGNAQELFS